jgi:hypothetical protein
MIGYMAVEPKPAKPPIGQIEMDFLAQTPLGADAKAITDDQYPDHQLGIDRWPTHRAVEGGQLPPQIVQLDKPVDQSQQMLRWNVLIERELIEQRSLFDLPVSHHDSQSCFSQ